MINKYFKKKKVMGDRKGKKKKEEGRGNLKASIRTVFGASVSQYWTIGKMTWIDQQLHTLRHHTQ